MDKTRLHIMKEFHKLQRTFGYLEEYELSYAMIVLSVKELMDKAVKHKIALETIRLATEEGIKWHVSEREGSKNHD